MLMKFSTTSIWSSRSSSCSGPFQMIFTPSSCAAFSAPACTDFQNSCVVPLGMTAMASVVFFLQPVAGAEREHGETREGSFHRGG